MYEFTFYNPVKIYFGMENLRVLPKEIIKYGRKVLLLYSQTFSKTKHFEELLRVIHEEDIQTCLFGKITRNPTNTLVDEIAGLCRSTQTEVILAVGGGTVIDCAKMVAAVSASNFSCQDIMYEKKSVDRALPVIAVPTTTATGSEMNCGGLISCRERKEKISFGAPVLFPKAAFIVPDFTCSLSVDNTAAGCADIMSHILENTYFTSLPKMKMNVGVQENIMRTLVLSSLTVRDEPYNVEARSDISWIASWALNGFLENGTGRIPVCHAMAHQLAGYYDIPHAQIIGIILPKWLKYIISDDTADVIAAFGKEVFGDLFSLEINVEKTEDTYLKTDIKEAECAVKSLECWLYDKLNLPSSFSEYHITDEFFSEMAQRICNGNTLSGLKRLGTGDLEAIMRACL